MSEQTSHEVIRHPSDLFYSCPLYSVLHKFRPTVGCCAYGNNTVRCRGQQEWNNNTGRSQLPDIWLTETCLCQVTSL